MNYSITGLVFSFGKPPLIKNVNSLLHLKYTLMWRTNYTSCPNFPY